MSHNVQIEGTEIMTCLLYSKSTFSVEIVLLIFDLPGSPPKSLKSSSTCECLLRDKITS